MNEGTCVAFGSAVRLTGSPGGSACNVGVAVASLTGIPLSFKVEDELPDLPDCEDVPLDVVLAVYDTGATPEPIAGVGAVLLPRNVPGGAPDCSGAPNPPGTPDGSVAGGAPDGKDGAPVAAGGGVGGA